MTICPLTSIGYASKTCWKSPLGRLSPWVDGDVWKVAIAKSCGLEILVAFFGCIHSEWVAIRKLYSIIYILLFIYYHCLCTYIILHDYDMNIWYVDTWYVDIWYILYRYIILIDTYIYMWIIRLCRAEKNTSNVAFLVGILNPSSVQRNEFFAMHSDLPWHLPQRSETIFMTEFPIFNDIMIDDIV